MAIVPVKEQEQILSTIEGLPPHEWLKNKTDDQRKYWENLRQGWGMIFIEMNAYFSGKISPYSLENIDAEYQYSHKRIEKWAKAMRRRWLDYYQLIHDCWCYLPSATSSKKLVIPSTPGDLLMAVMREECEAQLKDSESYSRFSPRASYKLYQTDKKVRELRNKKDLTKPEKLKIERFEKQVRQLGHGSDQKLYYLVYDLAKKLQKRDKDIARSLSRYHETMDELDKVCHSFTRPDQRMKGYQWIRGIKKPLS
ncbi:hypothetical protein [Crocosphaera sp. Alani8]|uniref:hypothetical protein n=1 Tax=Crocosphaera sp. Alani8 TaxID=3038952 RepID=UPI00313BEA12